VPFENGFAAPNNGSESRRQQMGNWRRDTGSSIQRFGDLFRARLSRGRHGRRWIVDAYQGDGKLLLSFVGPFHARVALA